MLGLVSGALSSAVWDSAAFEILKPVATVFFLAPGALPVGFLFACAMGIGVAFFTGRWWAFPVVLIVTIYAWSAAIHTAVRIQRNNDADTYLILASLAAGAVGAGITHFGAALAADGLRRSGRIALTIVVGAVLGLLFYAGHRKYIDERWLYALWQPAVAYCLGRGLGLGNRSTAA
jgi:hypothetical protein